jgi:hypothetical protein
MIERTEREHFQRASQGKSVLYLTICTPHILMRHYLGSRSTPQFQQCEEANTELVEMW